MFYSFFMHTITKEEEKVLLQNLDFHWVMFVKYLLRKIHILSTYFDDT